MALALLVLAACLIPTVTTSGSAAVHDRPIGKVVPSDPLAITSFNSSLSNPWVGEITFLNVTAVGGSPPYSYRYSGMPWSCHTANTSSLQCYLGEAQHFTITVTVNDSAGASAHASLLLVVTTGYGGPPIINYFYSRPATVPVNTITHILANATSISSTQDWALKFTYLDLPPGCASFNQTDLECIPSAPGTYHIMVDVTDGFGALSSAWTWLNVTGSSASNSTAPLQLPGAMWLGVGIVALVIIVAAILLIPRRRRRSPTGSVEPWKG